MAPPRETLWELEGHSKAKHEILRRYLGGWLPIMAKWNGRLLLLDGFAGPGRYTGGEEGSPLIMLKAYLEHTQRDRISAELVYAFIEENLDRVEHLEAEIAALGTLPDDLLCQVIHGNFEEVFRDQVEHLQKRNQQLAPTFAFIDPFGYTDAPLDLTKSILKFDRCEVLIYLPIPHINRWLSKPDQEQGLSALFGSDEWKKAIELKGSARKTFLHDLFRDQLKLDGGVKYVRSFEIINRQGTSGYHLFFGTNHETGLELMKGAMWRIDTVEGQTFRDSTDSGQLVLLGDGDPDPAPLERALRDHFGTQPFSIRDAELFALVDTPYLGKHLRKPILKPLERDDELEVLESPRKNRWTYPEGTIMRFVT